MQKYKMPVVPFLVSWGLQGRILTSYEISNETPAYSSRLKTKTAEKRRGSFHLIHILQVQGSSTQGVRKDHFLPYPLSLLFVPLICPHSLE